MKKKLVLLFIVIISSYMHLYSLDNYLGISDETSGGFPGMPSLVKTIGFSHYLVTQKYFILENMLKIGGGAYFMTLTSVFDYSISPKLYFKIKKNNDNMFLTFSPLSNSVQLFLPLKYLMLEAYTTLGADFYVGKKMILSMTIFSMGYSPIFFLENPELSQWCYYGIYLRSEFTIRFKVNK